MIFIFCYLYFLYILIQVFIQIFMVLKLFQFDNLESHVVKIYLIKTLLSTSKDNA